jgi:hypothetical protein
MLAPGVIVVSHYRYPATDARHDTSLRCSFSIRAWLLHSLNSPLCREEAICDLRCTVPESTQFPTFSAAAVIRAACIRIRVLFETTSPSQRPMPSSLRWRPLRRVRRWLSYRENKGCVIHFGEIVRSLLVEY